MRKLMWFTLGFGSSCALFAYLLPREWLGWLLAIFGVMGFACAVLAPRQKFFCRMALVFLGCTVGCFWFFQYATFYLQEAVLSDGKTLATQIHISEDSYKTDYGSAVDCTVTVNGKTYRAKAYLKDFMELEPGQEVAGDFRYRVTTPDGEQVATYHQGRGVFLLLYQKGDIQVLDGEQTWADRISVLRKDIKMLLEKAFPEDVLPFVKALLLGDTRDLTYEVDTALKISGIRHVVAVSGLHASILFALLSTLTVKNRFATAVLGFPVLLIFAALAGFTPSVVRSCLMLSLTLLALLLEKNYDGPTALSFAVLVMLAINPLTITDVGFQLSAGSVAGIYAFAGPVSAWGKGKRKGIAWLSGSVGTTLSAMAITTPLCAAYFGTVSLVSVVTNLLTLWVISVIFYGILAVCLLSLIWPFGASLVAWVVGWPIRYVLWLAEILAGFPLAAVYTESVHIVFWLVCLYVLLGCFWMSRNKKPGVLACSAVLSLCLALLGSWYRPMTDDVRMTVLDVGHGQSVILQSEGRTFLVDCGGESDALSADKVASTLLSQGIARLDGIIVTHGDRDHTGGIPGLLCRVDTALLILPPHDTGLSNTTNGRVVYADRDMTFSYGNTKITIFVPKFPGIGNENSVCILFDTEKCDILITGDRNGFGERSLLRNANIPDVDVLVAGHHGSKTSTCQELLDAVKPEIVCISTSADNHYGHPSPEVLQRLQKAGCEIYRTDLDGDILIRR